MKAGSSPVWKFRAARIQQINFGSLRAGKKFSEQLLSFPGSEKSAGNHFLPEHSQSRTSRTVIVCPCVFLGVPGCPWVCLHPQNLSQPLLQGSFQALSTNTQLLPSVVSSQGMLQPSHLPVFLSLWSLHSRAPSLGTGRAQGWQGRCPIPLDVMPPLLPRGSRALILLFSACPGNG